MREEEVVQTERQGVTVWLHAQSESSRRSLSEPPTREASRTRQPRRCSWSRNPGQGGYGQGRAFGRTIPEESNPSGPSPQAFSPVMS